MSAGRLENAGAQCEFDLMFVEINRPSDEHDYAAVCHHCGGGEWFKTDCKTVQRARNGGFDCECGGYVVLAIEK